MESTLKIHEHDGKKGAKEAKKSKSQNKKAARG